MFITLRYRHALLAPAAAEDFGRLYRDVLTGSRVQEASRG
jgi:hypothetical protein